MVDTCWADDGSGLGNGRVGPKLRRGEDLRSLKSDPREVAARLTLWRSTARSSGYSGCPGPAAVEQDA